ncbi:putative uncharacterized protein DDB_G0287457 [Oppia nitens]|uniref:putative uncharacterized protein DDB_G0287457 n=1 Tax=Oppia nitens TaxID=1686743 RepID=UPI0023DBD9D1|nr:putative uncharacterized protein DDB_G0287457 [Oppia nitens]XP_054167020.1 putative uncharacterized protein DDB_G0287457 [Oppia nitens]XP_054167021.1 putative uncharacterized protein DDB_G0287457 [Oppia nitens]
MSSQKLSPKLIEQLEKDEKIKDAFRLFAARIVNNSKVSSLTMSEIVNNMSDSSSDDDFSDNECEDLVDDEDDDESESEDKSAIDKIEAKHKHSMVGCKCKLKELTNNNKNNNKKSTNDKSPTKSKSSKDNTKHLIENTGRQTSEACICEDCLQMATQRKKSDEMAVKLIADEEKKKKKSEKKKLQKKKKREKRKAEKQELGLNSGVNNNNINVNKTIQNSLSNNNNNNNNINNKNNTNNNSKSDNISNKMDIKQKCTSKQNTDIVNEKMTNKIKQNNGNKSSDNKSNNSCKSEKDNDSVDESSVEEEELIFSSAYVSQIAQRKSKPLYNTQKTAQTIPQSDIPIVGHISDDNINSLENSNTDSCSDQFDDIYFKNAYLDEKNWEDRYLSNNNNNSDNNTSFTGNTNQNKREDEEPKYKQYFYDGHKQKSTKVTTAQNLTKEVKTQNKEKSIEFAILANQKAESNCFSEAIELFNKAVSNNPNDYRFYVNRSYCYDSIQDFRNALKDADTAIQLKPNWPKCHYRRGKALAGLKNYQEAEVSLKKVLTMETDCDEALSELYHVRYGAIVDMGYDTSMANEYSHKYESIKEALTALSIRGNDQKFSNNNNNNNFSKKLNSSTDNWIRRPSNSEQKNGEIWADDDIYISDDEWSQVKEMTAEDTSPTNPFGWKALWVGNVAPNAQLDTVTNMFRKFGNLHYCNIFKGTNGGNFILAHYDNAESPRKAMMKYQGKCIPGVSITDSPLTIRFRPNKDQKKPNYDQRLESDECYYWRTTGCARGDKCLYKHIPANRGVDKQAWMCNPLKKGLQPIQKSQK